MTLLPWVQHGLVSVCLIYVWGYCILQYLKCIVMFMDPGQPFVIHDIGDISFLYNYYSFHFIVTLEVWNL
jgi:hypothetical protein